MSTPNPAHHDDYFLSSKGYRSHHRSIPAFSPPVNEHQFGSLAHSAKGQVLGNTGEDRGNNARDQMRAFEEHLKVAKSPQDKMKLVSEALSHSKHDPKMTQQIIGTALLATRGADRAEIMGGLMQHHSAIVLGMDSKTLDLHDANLTGVSKKALQALPYNALNFTGATFPDGLDLSANKYMGGHGVDMDRVSMSHVTLPGNAVINSDKDARVEQSVANASTLKLTIAGGHTGFQAMPNGMVTPSGTVIDPEAAASDAPKIMESGTQAKNNHTVRKPELLTPFSTSPSPPA